MTYFDGVREHANRTNQASGVGYHVPPKPDYFVRSVAAIVVASVSLFGGLLWLML